MSGVDLSVVIPTFNRAALLTQALGALAAQEVRSGLRWEIVVVDNNSRDSTRAVVARFAEQSPVGAEYVFEGRQGLVPARNRGVAQARGAIVAFMDDDILPCRDWIDAIGAAMSRWDADAIGGRVLPKWPAPPPPWLAASEWLQGALAVMSFPESRTLTYPMHGVPQIRGGNMAFRRELLEELRGFVGIGRRGGKLYQQDETELIDRALQRGYRVVYDPAPTVFHEIGLKRMRRAYIRKLFFDAGEGEVVNGNVPEGTRLLGAPRWLYRLTMGELGEWAWHALRRRPDRFERQLDFLTDAGKLWGCWQVASGHAPRSVVGREAAVKDEGAA